MTLLDEKIAALFRKSSPISAGAEPTPSAWTARLPKKPRLKLL
jgi:hypothetical protein